MPSSGRTDLNIRPVSELQRSEIEMIKVRLYDLEVKEGAIAVADGSITNAKLGDMNQATVKGRQLMAGTGVPVDLTVAELQELVGSTDFTMAANMRINAAAIWANSDDGLEFADNAGNLGFIVQDLGKLSVNINPSISATQGVGQIQIFSASGAQLVLHQTAVSAGGPILEFLKRRSGFDVITAGDIVGEVLFSAADSIDAALAAQIKVTVDGTPGSNDMPGRITFLTSADGGATPAESFHINSLQNLIMADAKRIETDEVRARDSGGLILRDDGGNYGLLMEDGGRITLGDSTSPGVAVLRVGGTIGGAGGAALYLDSTTSASGGSQYGLRVICDPQNAGQFVGIGVHGSPNFTNYKSSIWIGNEASRPGLNIGYANTVLAPTHGAIILGQVGIGTNSPSSALDVAGIITARPTAAIATIRTNDGNARLDFITDRTVSTSAAFRFADAAGNVTMQMLDNGSVGVGNAAPDGQLDVVQGSTTAAIPVIELEQLDLSEEMINFVAAIATNNPIEVVGAKVFTPTHYVRVALNGSFRYMRVGTIA